ncbi:MAG: RelA/SpoT family protein [Gammaproteobacteria bacterium]
MVLVKQTFPRLEDDTIDFEAWLTMHVDRYPEASKSIIRNAYDFSQINDEHLATFYGQSCLEEGLECAEILAELQADATSIAAAIIFCAGQGAEITLEDIQEQLNPEIAKLIRGLDSMNAISALHQQTNKTSGKQIDNLRKMLLAMVSDVRVVLITLARRVCILRGVQVLGDEERKPYAEETMELYAPLANRLGISEIKWELEDLSFHDLEPETYKAIAKKLNETRLNRDARIEETIHSIKEKLKKINIDADVTGRAKHIYSIYKKMQRKRVPFEEIYDTHAVRIIVPTLDDCYHALSLMHETWTSITEEFDDYISTPKPNGYQSIHTAVAGPEGKHLEIQIRTHEMHEKNELGGAAHWLYKEGAKAKGGYEEKIAWLRELLEWHKELSLGDEQLDRVHDQAFEDRVYVFTPNGDIVDLVLHATPLDFAYHIHSDIGHRCRGAKVNSKMVPLTHQLSTGDRVEILTTKISQPSRDWLKPDAGYLASSRARSKVHHWFKQHDAENTTPEHKETKSAEPPAPKAPPKTLPKVSLKPRKGASNIHIHGMSNLLTTMANCCQPLPGDPITGYITRGRGVSIHRTDCQNILNISEYGKARIVEAEWIEGNDHPYIVDLNIIVEDTAKVVSQLTALLASKKIKALQLAEKDSQHIFLTVQLPNVEKLNQLIEWIKKIPTVKSVLRSNYYAD